MTPVHRVPPMRHSMRLDPQRRQPRQIGIKTTTINGQEYIVRVFEPAGFAGQPDEAGMPCYPIRRGGRYADQ